jgi:hypothetical protein
VATDFISTYVPAFVELSSEEVADCRERLAAFFSTMFPDLDTSPNTVLGDLILTPQAFQVAALEKGMDRFMSDLNLGNVAANKVYNCDFVSDYLKNFSVVNEYELRSSGVIRMVFSKDTDYELDRGTQFKIGNYIFSIYLPNNGLFKIHKVGSEVPPEENGTVLIDGGGGYYFADVPVVGHTGDVEVNAGATASINVIIKELGAANALVNFNKGIDTNSTAELAERARSTVYSASLNTRNGAIRYIESNCPFVESAYAIKNGDPEMLRGFNSLGAAEGCMDVYVRSKSYAFEEEQVVRLYYDSTKKAFEGELHYTGQPYYIDSVTHNGPISSQYGNLEHTITAVNTKGRGARGSYTKYEKLYITVPDQKIDGNSIFNPSVDSQNKTYADFIVNYHTDPLLPSIAATLDNPDYTPVNLSLQARGFIPIVIKKFNVRYVRKAGVVPDLETAEKEIRSYMDGLGAPDAYADSEISRIMGEAGVKYMAGIDVYATVQWSIGDRITPLNSTNKEDAIPTKNNTTITSSQGLRIKYPGNDNVDASSMYACSIRNTRYYMLDSAVSFTEVKEM